MTVTANNSGSPYCAELVLPGKCKDCGISSTESPGFTGGIANIQFICRPCWMKVFDELTKEGTK